MTDIIEAAEDAIRDDEAVARFRSARITSGAEDPMNRAAAGSSPASGVPYRTIVADPPWRYRTAEGITTRTRGDGSFAPEAALNYPTMAAGEVAALPIAEQADENAHLYLWVTNPMLPDAFPIIEAWGFRYVTLLTWRKLGTLGMGYYFRGDTEHVIFAVRGKAPIPADRRARNWFAAPKTGHSRKPDLFYEMVERVSPGPYLELFARRRRYGWDVWGNEAPESAASQAEMGLVG